MNFLTPQYNSSNKKIIFNSRTLTQKRNKTKPQRELSSTKDISQSSTIHSFQRKLANNLPKIESKFKQKAINQNEMKLEINQTLKIPQKDEVLESPKKEQQLQQLPKRSILGLRLPQIKQEVRNSFNSMTESETFEKSEESVVWNDDDLKIRGILPQIEEEKPINQFMELFKYRYESYPNQGETIENKKVIRVAKAFGKMNHRVWRKYFDGQNIQFSSENHYTEGYNPHQDLNFAMFRDYIRETKKIPRIVIEPKLNDTLQISQIQRRPSSKRQNFIVKSSIFKKQH